MNKLILSLAIAGLVSTPLAMAAGDPAAGETKAATCAGCHGPAGNSTNPAWPKLAGQNERYIAEQLAAFKGGETRKDPTMAPMAAPLSDQDMQDLGAYFAAQTSSKGTASSAELAEAGERLYRGGNAASGVPACMGCHGPAGNGNKEAGFPALSFQHATYTAKALGDFRSGARSSDYNSMMREIAARMTDREIEAVSEYIAGLN